MCKKKYWIVSSWSQKQYFLDPCQFRFICENYDRCKNYMNILILRGTYVFQRCYVRKTGYVLLRSTYMNLTVKTPLLFNLHRNTSSVCDILTDNRLHTKWSQVIHLSPTRARQKWIFKGLPCRIEATETSSTAQYYRNSDIEELTEYPPTRMT